MWPQGSQDAYYQNYYGQEYNRSNYNPNPQNPYYPNGGYGYGNPNPNASSPQIYQNNNRNPQMMQPIKLDVAMNKSSYSSSNRDIIFETILDNFSEKKENKVYLQSLSNNKIFTIIKNLNAKVMNKSYNIPIIIHIPVSYPNIPAEFYIQKKQRVGINKFYYENPNQKIIDVNSFKINTDKICPFDPSRNNLEQVIEALKSRFSSTFPIYADKSSKVQQVGFGPNNPEILKMNEVIVESEKMTNKQVYNMIKKQAKEAVLSKYNKFNSQYKLTQNYKELKTINDITRLKAGNSLNGNEHPMNESLNVLKKIRQRLYDIESGLNQEIQNSGNSNKTTLEKCDELIKIKDNEDMKLLIMKKTIEDYLIYLKKGYERKIVSFDEMVNQTRALSRELFSIDYLRSQKKC
jgi:hypothetical protein